MGRSLYFLILPLLLYIFAGAAGSDDKYHALLAKSRSNALQKLNDKTFAELTDAPRDHFSVVLLTALPSQFGCQLCREYQPEFNILAKSWAGGDKDGKSRVLFGTLDFPEGKGTFQKVSHPSLDLPFATTNILVMG